MIYREHDEKRLQQVATALQAEYAWLSRELNDPFALFNEMDDVDSIYLEVDKLKRLLENVRVASLIVGEIGDREPGSVDQVATAG